MNDTPTPQPQPSSNDTPNDERAQRDAAAALSYARQQVTRVYGDQSPVDTSAPAEYAQTYSDAPIDPSQQYDWQTYHSAWQEYYRQYYERYYLHQQEFISDAQKTDPKAEQTRLASALQHRHVQTARELQAKLRQKVGERAQKAKASPHFKPIVTALLVGGLFLFLQFNRTLIAQVKYYVSPGTVVSEGSSLIIDPRAQASVGPEPRLIIPKINVDVPVVYGETSYDETKIQGALEKGVVHYGNSAVPGQIGNNVIVGHSSNDLFDAGGYKFAFVLLDRLENGDLIVMHHEGKRYVYKVFNEQVIVPTDFSLINISPDKPVLTLITCTPPGTTLRRLVVQAEQISPAIDADQVAQAPNVTSSEQPASIPGNSPTLVERLQGVFR